MTEKNRKEALRWVKNDLTPDGFSHAIRDTLIAALSEPVPQGWQKIETAPRDGTRFIAYSPTNGVMRDVQWSIKRKDFDYQGFSGWARNWTHWQPQQELPQPPKESKNGE